MESMRMHHWSLVVIVGLALSSSQVACNPGAPCDAGEVDQVDSGTVFGKNHQTHVASDRSRARCDAGFQCLDCDVVRTGLIHAEGAVACVDGSVEAVELSGVCVLCLIGDHCPEGTVNRYGLSTATLCPDGMLCKPESGEWRMSFSDDTIHVASSLAYTTQRCPTGHQCGAGTAYVSEHTSCQEMVIAGLRALKPTEEVRDDDPSGYYCGPGTSGYETLTAEPNLFFQQCRKGKYCPNATARLACPEGHYCKLMVSQPEKCPIAYERRSVLEARAIEQTINLSEMKQKLRQQIFHGLQMGRIATPLRGFKPCNMPITISFHQICLSLPDNTTILDDVSGRFSHSQLAAIMGPSGCGKTSLINVLSGKAGRHGKVSGYVAVNEKPFSAAEMKGVMGFVPQDDTVLDDLTVLENIQFSAKLRLQPATTVQARHTLVLSVLEILGLTHIQNSCVGSVEKRGISGGQKKRVNIGVEMVADPSVLFLDEPTSGLGATDTLLVMKALHSFALNRHTVIAVIHQPRYQVRNGADWPCTCSSLPSLSFRDDALSQHDARKPGGAA
ncbi:hypothetical protein CYMTET_24341 [Cymbomonas tetramitiformis]|uniref:ABC transporter domain-containing protein n=1 Tax=Cymbomonas tetramitiformis TaxID=36881 RepID=A0AAE0L003_9CHLO|nr:hypothetical protein CYMTET_24341 [Cymbomonas tetramitiformis]